jgi:ABC-2 type transport system permease protein
VPNRRLFLVAKATTFAMVAFLVGEFASFVAFFAGQSLISGGAPHATITQSGVLGAVIGSGLYLTVLGLLAVGLGLIIRHTAGALAAFVGVLLIVSLLTPAFPSHPGRHLQVRADHHRQRDGDRLHASPQGSAHWESGTDP